MPRAILVLFCLGAVLLSTGCGSGGSSSHRLSQPEFRSRANRICDQLDRQQQSNLASKAGVDESLHRLDTAASRLERLHPPAGEEKRYGDLLTRFKRSVSFVKAHESRLVQLALRLRENPSDSQTLKQYRRLVRSLTHDIQLAASDARALGLGACANGLSGGGSGSQSSP